MFINDIIFYFRKSYFYPDSYRDVILSGVLPLPFQNTMPTIK